MDTALVGFVGVIAGAVTTGAVQFVGEWLGRRNDSQAAARLLYGALVEFEQAMDAYLAWGYVPPDVNFERQSAVWEAQREKLARVLDVVDFHRLQAAFSNMQGIIDVIDRARRAGIADGGIATLRADKDYKRRIDAIHDGQTIALGAGRRVRDRLQSRQKLERLASPPPDSAT